MAMTPPSTYGTATAPVPGSTAKQDEWWNTGNTGLIGQVTTAKGNGYTAAEAAPGAATTTNANAATVTGGGYDASKANAATYGATNWNVSAPQTVAGQLDQILSSGSPLLDRATTRANQQMNGRGLINSSMAVGAGQSALYDAALPIAQQDATTNANSAQFNATAANTSNQFNAGNQQQVNLSNQNAENVASQFGAAAENTAALQTAQNEQQANLANANAANATSATNAQLSQQAALANAAAKDTAGQFTANAKNTAALQNANAENSLQQQSNTIRQQAAAGNLTAQNQVAVLDLQQQFQVSMANADAQTKSYLTALQGEVQANLANIEADYKTLIQTSASASEIYKGAIGQIGAIISNENMDGPSKATALNGIYNNMAKAMNLVGSINGVDTTDLLDFGEVTADAGAEAP